MLLLSLGAHIIARLEQNEALLLVDVCTTSFRSTLRPHARSAALCEFENATSVHAQQATRAA